MYKRHPKIIERVIRKIHKEYEKAHYINKDTVVSEADRLLSVLSKYKCKTEV